MLLVYRILLMLMIVLVSPSCTTSASKLSLPVEVKSAQTVEVRSLRVNTDKTHHRLIVSGIVKPRYWNGLSPFGHVDLALFNSSGKVLKSVSVNYYPRITLRKGNHESRFTASLDVNPDTVADVKVSYHYLKPQVANT